MSLSALIASCLGARDALEMARREAPGWEAWLQPVGPSSVVGMTRATTTTSSTCARR